MNKRDFRIEFSPAYPPYQLEDTWQLVRKIKCGLNGRIVMMTGSYEECEKALKDLLKGE